MARDEIARPRRGPTVLERLAATFVAPGSARDVSAETPAAVAVPQIAVLAPPEDVWVAGGAAALARAGVAVVAGWGGRPPALRAPAAPRARRLGRALAGRGHAVVVSGRLVLVTLSGSGAEVAAEVARIAAACDRVPCIVALAGARDGRVDALLRGQDRVLVHADDELADLAVANVAPLAPARRLDLSAAPATARALAAAGVALVAPLRAAVEEALR